MEETCSFYMEEDLSIHSHEYLWLLYRPLAGTLACQVYEVMCAMVGKEVIMQDLLDFSGMSENEFTSARKKLEEYMLISTFTNASHTEFVFRVYAPKTPMAFLSHEILGRLLINNVSAGRFARLREHFNLDILPDPKLENISASLQASELEEGWSYEKEAFRIQHIPTGSELQRYPFNWELFYRGMDRTIPTRLRTRENMARIAYLSHIYGIGEEDMRRVVNRGINRERTYINFDTVKDILQVSYKTSQKKIRKETPKKKSDSSTMSPLEYFQSKLPEDTYMLPSERKLIVSLSMTYHFSDEVVRELLDYCLEKCSNRLITSYVEKVATSWAREKITTAQQARERIAQETKPARSKAPMPDWYYQEDPGVMSPELLEEIRALQKGIFEKNEH